MSDGTGRPRSGSTSLATVAAASLIGTTIEWYDFFIYGTAAALVFGRLFFPGVDPMAGTLASFATFVVAYVARPVGGVVFGHFGDRIGRKNTLVTTLLVMGVATFLIGALPTYAAVGFWAPVLLVVLRFGQGFAVGGEWGGAVLMTTEHAPRGRRGFYAAWPQLGVPSGLILSSCAFYLVARLPEPQLLAWGWRVPFLASIVLVLVGLVVRLKIEETPAARRLREERLAQARATAVDAGSVGTAQVPRVPVVEVVRRYPGQIVLLVGSTLALGVGFLIVSVFTLAYATQRYGIARDTMLLAMLIAAALDIPAQLFFGRLSDRIGRLRVLVFGAGFVGVFSFPYFALVNTGNLAAIVVAMSAALVFGHAACYSVLSSLLSESFEAGIRYTGVSFVYQVTNLASAPVPFVATALYAWARDSWAIALFLLAVSAVSVVAGLLLSRTHTAHQDDDEGVPPDDDVAAPVRRPVGAADPMRRSSDATAH